MSGRGAALFAAAALALGACTEEGLPEKRPPDLAVRYSWNLAPAEVAGELAIGGDGARYRESRGDNRVRFGFEPAVARLDALWSVLRRNRVDTLAAVEQDPGLRRSVETLVVRWGSREIAIRDGIRTRLRPADRARWRRIQLALREIILAERRKRGLAGY